MGTPAPLGLQGAYTRGHRSTYDELRTRLLDVAGRLLDTAGPESLTVRRIAAEAGCTTQVIYTMFGSNEGLAEALYLEASNAFDAAWRPCRTAAIRWSTSSRSVPPTGKPRCPSPATTASCSSGPSPVSRRASGHARWPGRR